MTTVDVNVLQEYVPKVRHLNPDSLVYKEECMYSFDNPESPGGLYICLNTFLGMGEEWVKRFHEKTGNSIFLCLKRKLIPKEESSEPSEPTKLAIGEDGGFNPDKLEFEHDDAIVVFPSGVRIPVGTPGIPDAIAASVKAVMDAENATTKAEVSSWSGDVREVSTHALDLKQLNNGVRVPPTGIQCSMCDLKDNLWMNLTDGTILCGRKQWDGSGGNGHALEHYNNTGHPLCVKLGTITAKGADVFSYAEDDMVLDPHLADHLAHFGIDMMNQVKTEKSMAELELEQNKNHEWKLLQEGDTELEPVYGAGHTGMINLGNSCYMSSVMQTLFVIPDFEDRYVLPAPALLDDAVGRNISDDFLLQMTKLGHGLSSGNYSRPPAKGDKRGVGIRPVAFKTIASMGHPEFSSGSQQDAFEYLQYILDLIGKKEHAAKTGRNPADVFKFSLEDRLQCSVSNRVRYTQRSENTLSLPVPMHLATNQSEVDHYLAERKASEDQGLNFEGKQVYPRVAFGACVEEFSSEELLDDWYSSATKAKGTARKTTRFASFPKFLLVHTRKFKLDENWRPAKLNVELDIPQTIDLEHLRAKGQQPGEELLEEEGAAPEVNINESFVQQLVEMGFPPNACRKGVYHTQSAGLEEATNWVMSHMDDPDFDAPLELPGAGGAGAGAGAGADDPPAESVMMLESMGFSAAQAKKALKECSNNLERAADWIFSHMDDPSAFEDTPIAAAAPASSGAEESNDGPGKYELVGFISHMGPSSASGHYVCHLKKGDQWVLFNDEKVAVSQKTPFGHGYLYLYKRI